MGLSSSLSCDISMNTKLTAEQRERYQSPEMIRRILSETKTIAMVGLSPNEQRPSYFVAAYLRAHGYRILPVTPMAPEILGEKSVADISHLTEAPEVVCIFRRPAECVEIVKQVIEKNALWSAERQAASHSQADEKKSAAESQAGQKKIKTVWMQLHVINHDAATLAEDAGLQVIMDKCLKMEHGRYSGNLHLAGMNTEIISAKKAHSFF